MNGFSDLHASFATNHPTCPNRTRLGNRWDPVLTAPEVAISASCGGAAGAILHAVEVAGWRLWAVGDLYGYRGQPGAVLSRLGADLADGTAEPAGLDAHAVVFAWDERSHRLHVIVDRLGTVHAYAGGAPGRRSVGTCFAAVAEGSAREPDWVGITGFCGFGFYPGDRTPWTDVRILRPATWTVFDDQGAVVSERRYWDWWFEPDHTRSVDDLLDELHDVWTRTVRTQIGDRSVALPLSGGLDSRTVFAAAVPAGNPQDGPRVHTLTYGYAEDSVEIRLSRRVARARGHRARELVVAPYLFDHLTDVVGAVEGFQSLCFSRQAGVAGELATMGEAVVGGHWGDVWFDSAGARPAGADGSGPVDLVETAHTKFTKRGRAWLFEHVCAPNLGGADPEAVLRELLADELARVPDLGDPDMALKVLKTEQWSFRWTLASVRAYQLALPTVLPFYANDVVDLFLRVPTDRLPGRRLQTAYLRRHHPDLARVTWQKTGMSLFERPWERPVALLGRLGARAARLRGGRRPVVRNWEVQYLAGDGPTRLRRALAGTGHRVVPPSRGHEVARFVEALLADPEPGLGYAADALMTLSATVTGTDADS